MPFCSARSGRPLLPPPSLPRPLPPFLLFSPATGDLLSSTDDLLSTTGFLRRRARRHSRSRFAERARRRSRSRWKSSSSDLQRQIQEMEGSFISLLNEGSFSQFEEMILSQQTPQSQLVQEVVHKPTEEPPKKKAKRSKNFLIEEDMLLISAWLNVSMDPVQGNNQTYTHYWDRIWKYYEENKEGLASERNANSLCNRWGTINEKVAKFIGFYNQICGRNQSGISEQDKVDQAIQMYERLMKEKFMFIRHWNALRFSPKYEGTLVKKNKPAKDKEASSQSVDGHTPISLDSEETMERPIGRKAAKKLKRVTNESKDDEGLEILRTMQRDALTIASSRSEALQVSLQLQKEMMELQREDMQLRLAKEERERQKEERERQKEEREKQIYEASIMAMDTSKMLPDQAKYYDALKARIMRNM